MGPPFQGFVCKKNGYPGRRSCLACPGLACLRTVGALSESGSNFRTGSSPCPLRSNPRPPQSSPCPPQSSPRPPQSSPFSCAFPRAMPLAGLFSGRWPSAPRRGLSDSRYLRNPIGAFGDADAFFGIGFSFKGCQTTSFRRLSGNSSGCPCMVLHLARSFSMWRSSTESRPLSRNRRCGYRVGAILRVLRKHGSGEERHGEKDASDGVH